MLHRELIYIWYYVSLQFRQIFVYWAAGIVIGSLVSVFLKKRIHGWMAGLAHRRVGIWGILPASALGILSPLCMYGTVPIAASFAKSGMREDWIAAFMMSSLLLNPQLFLYSLALGMPMAMIRLTAAFLGGCAAGLMVRGYFRRRPFYTFTEFELPGNHDTDPSLVWRFLKNVGRNIRVTFPYFLLGVVLTALYQRYVPTEWLLLLFGSRQGFGTLMAAAIGIPLYACGGGTIPLILAWLGEGMSPGSAVAFMVAGPATKLTNLGAVKTVLGGKNFILYLGFSILLADSFGLLVDLIL